MSACVAVCSQGPGWCWNTLLLLENLCWMTDWLTQELKGLPFTDIAVSQPVSNTYYEILWIPLGSASSISPSLRFPHCHTGAEPHYSIIGHPWTSELFLFLVFFLFVLVCTMHPFQSSQNLNLFISLLSLCSVSAQFPMLALSFTSPSYVRWPPVHPCKLHSPGSDHTSARKPSLISAVNLIWLVQILHLAFSLFLWVL